MEAESRIDSLPSVVLNTKLISLFFIRSTMWGRPSKTLFIFLTLNPYFSRFLAVPLVATNLNPDLVKLSAISFKWILSGFRTLKNADPFFGIFTPAASSAFSKASMKVGAMPITSPVDLISGPRIGSTDWNFSKGSTASFTEKNLGLLNLVIPNDFNDFPDITCAANFAKGEPTALETNGIVLDALGLTSNR